MGFDNTIDNRWRPDLETSQRRVQEEEADDGAPPRVVSRELSFVPQRDRPALEAHDAQTQVLIAEHKRLELLRHGSSVVQRLDRWRWIDSMHGAAQKQEFLEPLIETVRRDPVSNEDVLVFLLIVFEPIRRRIGASFMRARGGLSIPDLDIDWSNRTEARVVQEIDRQTLYDVTRNATVEAIFRYPPGGVDYLFPWFRETISWRVLDQLKGELSEIETTISNAAEAEAIQIALADLDEMDPPDMGETRGMRAWRRSFDLRGLYESVDEFFRANAVRAACTAAVGRLPRCQGEVIDGLFFKAQTPERLAVSRGVTRSTIDNTKRQARKNLYDDDSFFTALYKLGIVRDRARAAGLAARYPSGRLPDGRRIVLIDRAS